jgi:hypothetical protein
MRELARLTRLTRPELGVLGASAVLLSVVPIALRAIPLHRLLPSGGRRVGRSTPRVAPDRVVRLVAAVAARLPWRPTCLCRSLVAAHLITWVGAACTIVIGIAESGVPFEAHAWVDVDGRRGEPMPEGRWRTLARWDVPR